MRCTIQPTALAGALEIASKACGKANEHLAYSYVLLEATPDGGLTCTGMDGRTRAWRTADCLVERAGAVLLPPRAIADVCEAVAPDAPITISVDVAHRAVLTSGRTKVSIAGHDPELMPPGPDTEDRAAEIDGIPADMLRTLIQSVAFAASGDETRPALAGVSIECTGDRLTMTAADGLRLARRTLALNEGNPDFAINVPAERLERVASGLANAKGEVRLAVDSGGRHLLIDADTGAWALALIEDRFPDIGRMLTQEAVTTVTVARTDLLRACRLVSNVLVAITSVDAKTVDRVAKAILEIDADSVTVRAGDANADHEAVTVIDAATEPTVGDGGPIVTALNSGALREAAEALTGMGGVALELCGPGKSVFLRNAGEGRTDHVHMVQPLAVNNRDQRG